MLSATMVFKKPNGSIFPYVVHESEAEATREGSELAARSPGIWGEFLYARSLAPQPFRLGELYEIQPRQEGHLWSFRQAGDKVFLPLHYLRVHGPHRNTLVFPLTWKDTATGATCSLNAVFHCARNGKFRDMFKGRTVRFEMRNGFPGMEFLGSDSRTEIWVPLELHD